MTVQFRIDTDFREAQKLFGKKGEKRVQRAASRALNDTAKTVRKVATDEIFEAIAMKKKIIRRSISIKRARIGDLEALVIASGASRIPLIFTIPKPTQVKRGVRYTVNGKKRLMQSAFIAKMPGGHTGVFKRFGPSGQKKRRRPKYSGLHIEEQTAQGIPSAFTDDQIEKAMLKTAAVRWPQAFARTVKLELAKL